MGAQRVLDARYAEVDSHGGLPLTVTLAVTLAVTLTVTFRHTEWTLTEACHLPSHSPLHSPLHSPSLSVTLSGLSRKLATAITITSHCHRNHDSTDITTTPTAIILLPQS